MFGLQEILIIIGVILGLIFIPRMTANQRPRPHSKPGIRLTGKIRMAIVASFLFLGVAAAFLQPWRRDFLAFLYLGIAPVALAWLIYWVFIGFKNK